MTKSKELADFREYFDDTEYVAKRLSYITARTAPAPNGCAEFNGSLAGRGYTRVWFGGRLWQTHRLLWLIENGDIGELVIDHKCGNKRCVNLAHMEPVTNAENVRRGRAASHGGLCALGHRLSRMGKWLGCQTCKRDNYRRSRLNPASLERDRKRNRENMRRKRAAAI